MNTSSFHQFIIKDLPEKSIEYIVFLLLGLLIYFILDRYLRIRPKISAKIIIGPNSDWSSSSSMIPGQIEMKWNRQIVLKNISKHNSLDVQLIWANNNNPFNIKLPEHTVISGYDKYEISFVVKKSFPFDQVASAGSTRESLLPPELEEIIFVISYRSEKGKKFYTLFKFNYKKDCENFYYRLKPKI